jgi:hypothetical protein
MTDISDAIDEKFHTSHSPHRDFLHPSAIFHSYTPQYINIYRRRRRHANIFYISSSAHTHTHLKVVLKKGALCFWAQRKYAYLIFDLCMTLFGADDVQAIYRKSSVASYEKKTLHTLSVTK